jgi:hypothetical protein
MDFSILDPKGNVVATGHSAREARTKFRAGRGMFGKQTILDQIGAPISEAELDRLCAAENADEEPDA